MEKNIENVAKFKLTRLMYTVAHGDDPTGRFVTGGGLGSLLASCVCLTFLLDRILRIYYFT